MTVTGEEPAASPCSSHAYTEAGLPWFKYYDDDQVAIEGAKRLGNIKSINNVIPKTGDNIWVDEPSTIKQKIQDIIKKKVSSGKW